MFKKPISIQSNSKLKKAILRKVRVNIGKSLPLFDDLEEEKIAKLIPSKVEGFEITQLKGTRTSFYSYLNVPVFIDTNGKGDMIPTLFGLWLVPDQILTLVVDNGAAPYIINGAELMAPGLNCSVADIPEFEKGQYVAVALPCQKAVAIGTTMISSKELKIQGKKGKLVHIEHIVGDYLFMEAWTTSSSPHCSLPEDLMFLTEKHLKMPKRATIERPEGEEEEETKEEGNDGNHPESKELEGNNAEKGTEEEEEEEEQILEVRPTFTMDEVLKMSFMQGIKQSVSKDDLPIPGSVFYSLHMQPNRPRGTKLDIKKTSFKKLSKFLQSMAREGVITIKPLPKGEVQIMSIKEKHATFVEFTPYKPAGNKKGGGAAGNTGGKGKKNNSAAGSSGEKGFTITKLHRPTADLFPLFSSVIEGAEKTTAYTKKDAVDALWKYCEVNELSKQGKATVQLDSLLSRNVFRKKIAEGEEVTKQDLSAKFLNALQVNFHLDRDGVTKLVKTKLENIVSREERRGGHKYVTKIRGLETYVLIPKEVAKDLRKIFAASTTVNEVVAGKGKGNTVSLEVVIQGKMNHQVKAYLVKNYQIPAGNIELFTK